MQKAIESTKVNRNGGYCIPGHGYSACRIAECIDTCHEMCDRDVKVPSIRSYMSEAKIGSKDLAGCLTHIINFELIFKTKKSGSARQESLSSTMCDDLLSIELHML